LLLSSLLLLIEDDSRLEVEFRADDVLLFTPLYAAGTERAKRGT